MKTVHAAITEPEKVAQSSHLKHLLRRAFINIIHALKYKMQCTARILYMVATTCNTPQMVAIDYFVLTVYAAACMCMHVCTAQASRTQLLV